MLRTLALAGAALILAAGGALAQATTSGATPLGLWLTEGGKSHVQIYQCSAHLCGRIVWLREPLGKDGLPKVDLKNPDQSKRAQKIIGLHVLWNFTKSSDAGVWDGGRIYDPQNGETYKSTMTLRRDGKLEVRGYVGLSLLGRSQYWERVR